MERCLLGDESYWATASALLDSSEEVIAGRGKPHVARPRTWITHTALLSQAVKELYASAPFGRFTFYFSYKYI